VEHGYEVVCGCISPDPHRLCNTGRGGTLPPLCLAFGVRQMKPTVERLLVIQWSSLTSYDLLAGCQKFRSLDQYVILTARQEKASVSGSDVEQCTPWA
jgi:hypothetical protein